MKKYLFSEEFNQFKVIGFDLDGTLYDDFEFIEQVYKDICTRYIKGKHDEIYFDMKLRWLEKGSSYPFIFSEIKEKYNLEESFIENAISLYRNYLPILSVNKKMKFVLEKFKKEGVKTFLLTDGRKKLQSNKIKSLDIEGYFDYIVITESNPKPSNIMSYEVLDFFKVDPKHILYIGDRDCDKNFSINSGFKFCHINDFI